MNEKIPHSAAAAAMLLGAGDECLGGVGEPFKLLEMRCRASTEMTGLTAFVCLFREGREEGPIPLP